MGAKTTRRTKPGIWSRIGRFGVLVAAFLVALAISDYWSMRKWDNSPDGADYNLSLQRTMDDRVEDTLWRLKSGDYQWTVTVANHSERATYRRVTVTASLYLLNKGGQPVARVFREAKLVGDKGILGPSRVGRVRLRVPADVLRPLEAEDRSYTAWVEMSAVCPNGQSFTDRQPRDYEFKMKPGEESSPTGKRGDTVPRILFPEYRRSGSGARNGPEPQVESKGTTHTSHSV